MELEKESSRVNLQNLHMENPPHDRQTMARFPLLSNAGRFLTSDVASNVEKEIGCMLLESKTPSDVTSFRNINGTAEGSVILRAGANRDQVSFVLESWLHCKFTVGNLDTATIIVMLGPNTDAPHFMFEVVQNDSESIILLLDLLPRKDLVLDPEYLKRFYEDTELEKVRHALAEIPQSQSFVSSSLYVRSVLSPTAILLKFTGLQSSGEGEGLDRIMKEILQPAVKEVFYTWLNAFLERGRLVEGEEERLRLVERDEQIRSKGIETDLRSNLPKLFGTDVTESVLAAYRKGE